MKTYTELSRLETFKERFQYLVLDGTVGEDTFGVRRFLNQQFYISKEWKHLRNEIITRDMGCEMGLFGHEIVGPITIHHINPIRMEDIINKSTKLIDPENLVCVSDYLHRAIHYGPLVAPLPDNVIRQPNDMCPWRQ